MPRAKDLTGQRFGRLVAIEPTAKRCGGSVVWRCRCDCGNESLVSANALKEGNTRSCGCLKKEHIREFSANRGAIKTRYGEKGDPSMIGRRFGRLVVKEFAGRTAGSAMLYRCECDCGNVIVREKSNLTNGTTRSCGCLRREKVTSSIAAGSRFGELAVVGAIDSRFRLHRNALWLCECSCGRKAVAKTRELLSGTKVKCGRLHGKPVNGRFRDLAGEQFGSLLVIRESGRAKDGNAVWRCLCECGRCTDAKAGNLVNGHTTSCGCRKGKPVEEGERFGSLVAVERVGTSDKGQSVWRCECDCGGEREATGAELRYGNVTSCGCGETKRRRAAEASGVVDGTRLSNLNGKPPKNNTSGVRGVFWNKRRHKWQAQIKFQGKNRFLGYFDDLADAAEARREAEQELFDPVLEAHGRAPTSEEEYEEALSRAVEAERESEN